MDDDEYKHIFQHQLELFGMAEKNNLPDSTIIKEKSQIDLLHDWLEEGDSDGDLSLLYRGSRDGFNTEDFHFKCDSMSYTLTIIETAEGYILGGYSNLPWTSNMCWYQANKAFCFVISGSDVSIPQKWNLCDADDHNAVFHSPGFGPVFGCGHDLAVMGPKVELCMGNSYDCSNRTGGSHMIRNTSCTLTIKEIEVFQVSGEPPVRTSKKAHPESKIAGNPISRFADDINKAMNEKRDSLLKFELEIQQLEDSLKDEITFVDDFVCGDTKDVVVLNVNGTIMTTKRATLCSAANSVLAQQFDDDKWTEQGCYTPRVKEWTPDDVCSWAKTINGVSDKVADMFVQNEITGNELLALNMDGLKMIGIGRAGTLCLLLEEIKMLKQSSEEFTLIEHSPYCFGKILDYLRLKHLHSQGLVDELPTLPTVRESQKKRYDKVKQYFFPGDPW